MSKKEIEQLEKRIDRIEKCLELLEMETKELKSVDPGIIEERFKSIEETLYSTKEILSMKDVCHYLDISPWILKSNDASFFIVIFLHCSFINLTNANGVLLFTTIGSGK